MATERLIAVRLDNSRIGGGPGTVVAVYDDSPAAVAEFHKLITDRDGARDPRMRLWRTSDEAPVGARFSLTELVCGTGRLGRIHWEPAS